MDAAVDATMNSAESVDAATEDDVNNVKFAAARVEADPYSAESVEAAVEFDA